MATKNSLTPISNLSNAEIMNAVRMDASTTYQERIPLATKETLQATGNAILSYEVYSNEFLRTLVDKIIFQYVHQNSIRNVMGEFKRGTVPFGRTVEEIYADIVMAQAYDPERASQELFKRHKPNVSSIYHTINRADVYPTTVEYVVLRRAFYNEGGLSDLIAGIVNALYNSDNYDEFLIMKNLLGSYYANGLFTPIVVEAVTDDATASAFVAKVRGAVTSMALPSRKYNSMGVMRTVAPEDQILFIRPELEANIDVSVLAAAFHMDKAEFLARRVVLDDFGEGTDNVLAILCDRELIIQYDTFYGMEQAYNGMGLYYNLFLHHQGIYSTSRFANAVAFTTTASDVTTVTVAGTAEVNAGQMYQYTATVAGTASNYVPKGVIWSITGNNSADTEITMSGELYIASNETSTAITVKATSVYDGTKAGTLALTVTPKG